jgi:hypothetical protein
VGIFSFVNFMLIILFFGEVHVNYLRCTSLEKIHQRLNITTHELAGFTVVNLNLYLGIVYS